MSLDDDLTDNNGIGGKAGDIRFARSHGRESSQKNLIQISAIFRKIKFWRAFALFWRKPLLSLHRNKMSFIMEKNNKGILFARYLWLYGELVSKGPITYGMINEDWKNSTLNENSDPLPHKTFENHRKALEEMFDISIECDRKTNSYFIEHGSEPNFVKATMDLLNGALLFYRIQTNPQIQKFIHPEESGNEYGILFTIIDALTEERELSLLYRHNYDKTKEINYRVKPIALKQFHRRWYLIAELENDKTYSFPLDRILTISKGEIISPSILSIDDLFKDSYGIIREDSVPVERIVLRVEREQANYFLSRPLHESQNVLEMSERFVTFSLHLCPTYDFIMEILSHGPRVEVLEPLSLRYQIADKINQMANLYTNKQI